MNILNFILAQQGAGAQGSGMSGIFMIVAMIVIFYFFMIRPQQRKQKKIRQQREALTKGDKVVTAGGIHGKITADKGTYFMVEIAPGTTIRVEKTSIYPLEEAPAKKEEKKEDRKAKEETPALEDNKD
jgi:preprotein translocase subunit YajC